jgi:hypothetical protein
MGQRGPIPKSSEDRQGHRSRDSRLLEVVPPAGFDPGPAPLDSVAEEWEVFWSSPTAKAIRREHLPVVRRLFELRAHRDALMRVAAEEPLVAGSSGQIRTHPAYSTIATLEGIVRQLENELGLTPRALAALGLTTASATLTVQQINAAGTLQRSW